MEATAEPKPEEKDWFVVISAGQHWQILESTAKGITQTEALTLVAQRSGLHPQCEYRAFKWADGVQA